MIKIEISIYIFIMYYELHMPYVWKVIEIFLIWIKKGINRLPMSCVIIGNFPKIII